jgi:ActR/RegA family two-component response regulator
VPLRGKRILLMSEAGRPGAGQEDAARLLGFAAERRGATVALAAGPAEALATLAAAPVDAAVLDLAGNPPVSALLAALRVAGAPVAAISRAGGEGAGELLRLGVSRIFERPLAVEEILAAIGRLLAQRAPPARRAAPATPAATATPMGESEWQDFDSLVFSSARPALDEEVPAAPPAEQEWLSRQPPSPALPSSAGRPSGAPRPPPPEGDLADVPVPRLITFLFTDRATGALSLVRGAVKKLILLEGGLPVCAASNVPQDRFGARCVREGILSTASLTALVRNLGPRETTAAALMARGLVTAERRARIVAEQVLDIIWSTFDWRDGHYRIVPQAIPHRGLIPLSIFPGDLILEGMRRFAALDILKRELPEEGALAPLADPPFELHQLSLRSREAEMLALADGTKSVRDLVLLSGLHEREALAFLQACRHMGILDETARVLASTRRIGFM